MVASLTAVQRQAIEHYRAALDLDVSLRDLDWQRKDLRGMADAYQRMGDAPHAEEARRAAEIGDASHG